MLITIEVTAVGGVATTVDRPDVPPAALISALRTALGRLEAAQPELPGESRTVEAWLRDALCRYQVTHVHAAVREALRLMAKEAESEA